MAWARPSSPVSTARSGRTMGSGRNWRSSRRSRGSSPARRNDDLPAPDGPRITNRRLHPRGAHPAQHVQPAQDLGVAPEEHRRIGLLQRCPPPIRGAVRITRRRPREMLGPDPQGAQTVQQPLQALGVQHHRLPAIGDVDFGGGAVVGEQVAALPLRGDVGVGHRLQPGAQDGLVQRSRRSGTRSCTRARLPSASTAGRSPPRSGCWPAAAPASTAPRAGSRCAGPDPRRSPRPDPAPARSATP